MKDIQYVYLIGVGGIGMSAIARWFKAQGLQVFGYEQRPSKLTDQLTQEGIQIHFEDLIETIPAAVTLHKEQSLVVYTPAVSLTNSILNYLQANRYQVVKRAVVLGMITQQHFTLAVAGTHGKTSTTALAIHLLYSAGKSVIGFLGGIAKGYESNLIIHTAPQEAPIMVVEADEFDRSFLHLKPELAIVTTVDPDHLDTYGHAQEVINAFNTFIASVLPAGQVVLQNQSAQQLQLAESNPNIIRYALTNAPIRAENIHIQDGDFYFDYVSRDTTLRNLRLTPPGYHHVENALAVITACLALGLEGESIRKGMATFQGVKRRFDYVICTEQLIFLDDFAHHPVEIKASLQTIRKLYPDKKLSVIFRPHLYTRTRDFAAEFAQSLDLADIVFLLDIDPDREKSIEGVTAACIFDHMTLKEKVMCTRENLLEALDQHGKPEILVLMGPGDAGSFVPLIKDFLLAHGG